MSRNWKNYDLFFEAYDHCRWKTVLQNFLTDLDISVHRGKTFEDIFSDIYNLCRNVKGLGMLSVYDITASICRYYNVTIDRVYIIGGGPKRAVKLLKLKTYSRKFNNIRLVFVEINDVKNRFNLETTDGDVLETFLCKWQKAQSYSSSDNSES